VVAANHEFSSGQFEINLWHSEALDAADRAFRFKTAVQELARMDDRMATFMAKPFNEEGGSGFHIHFSTWSEGGEALFDDPTGQDGLSTIARHAIAGVLLTRLHSRRCTTRQSTPTNGSVPTPWRRG
jgi:glutamine synthetase